MVTTTSSPSHLIAPATFPSIPDQLSVLSYNVLLPNSQDGWWNYKMYQPSESDIHHISSWEYRSQLLHDRIKLIDPDVVCMQEVSPLSFEVDFQFMNGLGYDGAEMFKRGRFRPATFWKSSKCKLVSPPVHKDRTLLTAFQLNLSTDHPFSSKNWHVLNCHLQAGQQGKRRVRQIDEGVKASFKLAKKLNEPDPTNPLLIVCGDFNGGSECGAVEYVEAGGVGPSFIEDGEPVSSKEKKIPLSYPLLDVAKAVERIDTISPPPTLVVSELISQMVKKGSEAYQDPELSEDVVERLQRCYQRYAKYSPDSKDSVRVMNKSNVEQWLIDINGQVGRGSEFRKAAREMGWKEIEKDDDNEEKNDNEKSRIVLPENGILTLNGFVNVYEEELRGGKFWGIAHDLHVMNETLPNVGTFTARFDRMYCTASLTPSIVLDTIATNPCPNEIEPSDHLPVAASFRVAGLN